MTDLAAVCSIGDERGADIVGAFDKAPEIVLGMMGPRVTDAEGGCA
jgi:hypothetical protein